MTPSSTIAIMIQSSAFSSSNCQTALDFAKTVIQQGRQISILFFYNEAVTLASELTVSLQGELNLTDQWQQFILENNLQAVACITAALKRGILDNTESKRYDKKKDNLAKGIELGGLGQWVDAVNRSDQHIIFG